MKPVCIFISDLHLYDKAPKCRKGETDWIAKQSEYLNFLKDKQSFYKCPIIIAGDIFHKWFGISGMDKTFLNLIIETFQKFEYPIYSISGNHDLPNHNINLLMKSAYKTLTLSCIEDFSGRWITIDDTALFGYHFGMDLKHPKYLKAKEHIAVIHELIWETEPFINAPVNGNVKYISKLLKNFNVIVAGDNHIGFDTIVAGSINKQRIINCGSMMRTNTLQMDYKPGFAVYYDKDTIERVYFDISNDIISEEHIVSNKESQNRLNIFSKLLDTKKNKEKSVLDFEKAIDFYMKQQINIETRNILQEVLDESN